MYRAAYGFYKQMTDLQVKYSLELRCTILKMFCDLNELEMAEAFFKQLKEGHEPSTFSYCILMRGHVVAKNYQRVLELYNEMIENKLPESELSRRYLIVSCAGIPTLSDRVLELYSVSYKLALEEYEKNGIPDTELIVILVLF
jgi:pentatricopeptide repeat protein